MRIARGSRTIVVVLIALAAHAFAGSLDTADARKARRKAKPRHHIVRIAPPPAVKPERPAKLLTREEILAADPERLARIGRHLMIGYHDFAAVKALVEKRAISGLFITDHNVRTRSAADTLSQLSTLQAIRAGQGLSPLLVGADQEGGTVSRLTPPLKRQPSLRSVLMSLTDDAARETAVRHYAKTQAAELRRIGVTVNFSPVVDLNVDPAFRNDGETRLRTRAISSDPYLVMKVARWYCGALAEEGLMCTLKHFPGLGHVRRDTHLASAEVTESDGKLELNDWLPFRHVMSASNALTMLGHVRIAAIDKSTPASFSSAVVEGLIRKRWAHDGLVITDDFSMGAVTRSADGVGGAAVKALKAGVDLILVSFSEKDLNAVMSALLEADAAGEFDDAEGTRSAERLARAIKATKDGMSIDTPGTTARN